MTDALETGRDLGRGARYHNLGIHGAAAASAADALAAVRRHVFELARRRARASCSRRWTADFAGHEALRRRLAEESPRVGLNDRRPTGCSVGSTTAFADACEAERPRPGRIVRPGTGIGHVLPLAGPRSARRAASRAGRRGDRGRPPPGRSFGANLAPTPGTPLRGPISVLQSYAKIDYRRICNGGPDHAGAVRLASSGDAESIRKVALLVRTFAQLGCQQLQLNALTPTASWTPRRIPRSTAT